MIRMRIAVGALTIGGATALAPTVAWADATPSPHDLAAASQAAAAAKPILRQFFASHGRPNAKAVSPKKAAATKPRLTAAPTAVYDLDPEFVKGKSKTPARLAYLSTPAAAADGQTASVWTARDQRGKWTVINIASGTDEKTYADKAGPKAIAFREPQTKAWYALRGGRVIPLNKSARTNVGSGIPVAAYQQLVKRRYGDKMPGSPYDKSGKAGGYGTGTAAGAGTTAPAEAIGPADTDKDGEIPLGPLAIIGMAVVATAGTAWRVRWRRR